jgi:hypothetical protein
MAGSSAQPKPTFIRGVTNETTIDSVLSDNEFTVASIGSIVLGDIVRVSSADVSEMNEMLGQITAIDGSTVTTTYGSAYLTIGRKLWVPEFAIEFNSYPMMPFLPLINDPADAIDSTIGRRIWRTRIREPKSRIVLRMRRMDRITRIKLALWHESEYEGFGSMNEYECCVGGKNKIYTVHTGSLSNFIEYEPDRYSADITLIVIETLA